MYKLLYDIDINVPIKPKNKKTYNTVPRNWNACHNPVGSSPKTQAYIKKTGNEINNCIIAIPEPVWSISRTCVNCVKKRKRKKKEFMNEEVFHM